MAFQIAPLPAGRFAHLHTLNTEQLADHNALRVTVDKKPGFPCRVSLTDAEPGEEVLLVHYEHHSAATPFRAGHAVYIRPHATEAHLLPNQVPEQLRTRILSLRGFSQHGMLCEADLADGALLEPALEKLFSNPQVAYIHIHFAKPGCYAAIATRAC